MASAETVELPKDRKGRVLHIGDEVLVYRFKEPRAQAKVLAMTLVWTEPVTWYADLHVGAIGDRRFRTSARGFEPYELEIIEEAGSDGSD